MAELWRTGLRRLQGHFDEAVRSGTRLDCLLIESVNPSRTECPAIPPGFADRHFVYVYTRVYRPFGILRDQDGHLLFGDKTFFDLDGKPIANSAGDPYACQLGATRSVHFFGDSTAWNAYETLAKAAGACLEGLPNEVASLFPKETRTTEDELLRWTWALFDLAWKHVPASPLRLKTDKSAWLGNSSIALHAVSHFRKHWPGPHPAKDLPDPPEHWYAVLENLLHASVWAIDILVTVAAPPASTPSNDAGNVESTTPPTAMTGHGKSEGNGGDGETATANDGTREERLSAFLRELTAYENAVRDAQQRQFFPLKSDHALCAAVQHLGGLPAPEPLTTWLNLCDRSHPCRTVTGWRNRRNDILVTDIPKLRAWAEDELKKYDVFLAYNSKDKQAVLTIAEQLKGRGIRPWLAVEQTPPGRWFQDVIQDAIPKVKSAAVILGPHGIGKWQAVELRSFISQCVERGIPVIPVLLPGVDAIPDDLGFLRELHWVKFRERLDEKDALDQLVWGITAP